MATARTAHRYRTASIPHGLLHELGPCGWRQILCSFSRPAQTSVGNSRPLRHHLGRRIQASGKFEGDTQEFAYPCNILCAAAPWLLPPRRHFIFGSIISCTWAETSSCSFDVWIDTYAITAQE